ncbi:MAG TPA: DUF4132 domain-containing protein [Actinospica sp.]|nr:DUF4132 domain-containing protein [Actinospica sp.]
MRDVVDVEDEERFVVPREWHEAIHPRHGAIPAGVAIHVPEHTGSTAEWDALLESLSPNDIEKCASNARTLPAAAEALREHLAGKPSPASAAALLVLLERSNLKIDPVTHVDAWVTAHGLRFAAAATVWSCVLTCGWDSHVADRFVYEVGYDGLAGNRLGVLRRTRGYLAAADDTIYKAVVEDLAELRAELRERVVVSYLLPTEAQWLSEVCERVGRARLTKSKWAPWTRLMQCSITTEADLAALRKRAPFQVNYSELGVIATATASLGVAAVPLFPQVLDGNSTAETKRNALDALARIPSDAAFAELVARLNVKLVQKYVMEAAHRFPRRAMRLLARLAATGDEAAETAQRLLTTLLKQYPDLVEDVRFVVSAPELVLVDQLRVQIQGRPVAPDSALPDLLVDPPWTAKQPRATNLRSPFALQAPAISRVDWLPGEQAEFDRIDPAETNVDWEKVLDSIEKNGSSRQDIWDRVALLVAPEDRARAALKHLRNQSYDADKVWAWGSLLGRFGIDVLEPMLYTPKRGTPLTNRSAVFQPIVDLRVARLMADWMLRLKTVRADARSWFERHTEDAATLLIPDALGTDKALRPGAEAALRYLALNLGFDVVAVAERGYGAEAAARVGEVVAVDRLDLLPARMPKLPAWLLETHLPQILLRDRSAGISEQATQHVMAMLAISRPGDPYAGLEVVRQFADPASLAAFAQALLAAWRTADYPSDHAWILTAQGTIGDAETVRRLVPLMVAWPRENGHHRAVAGLDVMVDVGDDAALFQVYRFATATGIDTTPEEGEDEPELQLDHLVQTQPRKGLKRQAQQRIARTAALRGLTVDQLADRLLPDLGLDESGAAWLDYGLRRFRVTFDEQSKPQVIDESRVTFAELPMPGEADDAELAAAARERLEALTEDVQAVVAHAVTRFESGMALGRSWSAEEFRTLLHQHPVLWRVVRGVVWLSEIEGVTTAFRVAEDGGFADVDDELFELPEQCAVRVAHPLQLGADLSTWSELFADYEIVQPFAQLGRAINTLTEAERAGAPFSRFSNVNVPVEEVRGLFKRGWELVGSRNYSTDDFLKRPTLDGRWLFVGIYPGLGDGFADEYLSKQRLGHVVLHDTASLGAAKSATTSSGLHDLDPLTVSELIGDLSRMMI